LDQFSYEQQELIAELIEKQIKFSINEIIDIRRLNNGKIIFLEQGNQFAGLQHILSHATDFEKRDILPNEIADAVIRYSGRDCWLSKKTSDL